jgi:hypothetical protein
MKFTTPPNKDYKQDISILHEALLSGENISFSKFCDGEWAVIANQPINNKEFWFDPNSPEDQLKREELIKAFKYKNDRYFVGITCVNVFGLDVHRKMTELSDQNQDHLTWADIWVNSNYSYYLKHIVPFYKTKPVVLVCNKNAKTKNLPFSPYLIVPVENNAWKNNWNLVEEFTHFVKTQQGIKDMIFLFCCGPFGNILCHKLTEANPDNIYLDVGSTLNPFLQSAGFERDYYMGNNYFSNMVGAWDQ